MTLFLELLKFFKTHLYFSIKHTICQEGIAKIVGNLLKNQYFVHNIVNILTIFVQFNSISGAEVTICRWVVGKKKQPPHYHIRRLLFNQTIWE
jgi:hypothetical protein